MKKIVFISLSLLCYWCSNAQNNPNSVSIVLSSDLFDAYLYYSQKLELSCSTDVTITGSVISESSVLITPKYNYGIIILPVDEGGNYSPPGTSAREKGGTTVIKSKGTGSGRPAPDAIVYPNPVQNTLTFYTANNFAIAASVYDLNGILLLNTTMQPSTEGTLNVSNLPVGNYILKIDLIDTQFIAIQFIKN